MSELPKKITDLLTEAAGNPLKLIGLTIVVLGAGFLIQVALPYDTFRSNGSGALLHPPGPLELKGQVVYKSNGCMYCHTQNLRPFAFEISRFANAKEYGYFPYEDKMERYFESPYMRGSRRIGPDLSRLSGKYDAEALASLLSGKSGSKLARAQHKYGYLFAADNSYTPVDALVLSWRIRAMMQAGSPFSDADQKGVFDGINGRTKGEALTAYLLSLGARKRAFAGKYFKD